MHIPLYIDNGRLQYPVLSMDRSFRQKVSREILELIDVMNQMDMTNIHRTYHPNTKVYTFFLVPHGTLSKIDHVFGHKPCLNRHKKTEVTACIISDNHELKLDFNNRNHRKLTNSRKLNNSLLNNICVKEKIKKIKIFKKSMKMNA